MTIFIRALLDNDKAKVVQDLCNAIRKNDLPSRVFDISPRQFREIPSSPFAYWVPDRARAVFGDYEKFERDDRTARQGLATADDFRFARSWWEVLIGDDKWSTMSKGGPFSPFYADFDLVVNWTSDGHEMRAFTRSAIRNPTFYYREGLTWSLRTHRFCPQVLPRDTVISTRGSGIYTEAPLTYLALFSSSIIDFLMRMLSGREGHPQYDMGDVSLLPIPKLSAVEDRLAQLARNAWSLSRTLDTTNEISHAFMLPSELRSRIGEFDVFRVETELRCIQSEIDKTAFDLYGFDEADSNVVRGGGPESPTSANSQAGQAAEADERPVEDSAEKQLGLLTWCVGVVFGRFDWRLATGERAAPPEPEPFDPLPSKSPGMLPDGDAPFHQHFGILVDDPGHPHDLARLVELVLERIDVPAPSDVRRWLQREFFKEHLSQYSKSRRKAPIYWPLSTSSGKYTLWIYYPSLTSQSLYTAVNDFLEPKLKEVTDNAQALRNKMDRSAKEEKEFVQLQDLEIELKELRETILKVAKDYAPNHDDGAQITAAPLWPLFQHKPWQKVLKDTWKKLEKGDYDWAHLAMNYWPDRVREKCKTDKSLAIAHGLEDIYSETS